MKKLRMLKICQIKLDLIAPRENVLGRILFIKNMCEGVETLQVRWFSNYTHNVKKLSANVYTFNPHRLRTHFIREHTRLGLSDPIASEFQG